MAAAVLELLSSLLVRGAPGSPNATAPVTVESHAVYVVHRLLQTQVAKVRYRVQGVGCRV